MHSKMSPNGDYLWESLWKLKFCLLTYQDYSFIWNDFRPCSDIRGVAVAGVEGEPVTLTEPVTEAIAAAFGAWLLEKKKADGSRRLRVSIGHDSRISAQKLQAILPLLSGQRRGIPKSLTHGCLHAPGWGQGEFSAYSAKTLATQKLKKLGRQLLKEWKLFITQRSFYKCLEAHLLGALAK
ncbi:hypothetical protein CK203_036661 [Vitis vinifera]|uniref:Uncharacterized protein n=1 Tax=Vitis vinifera TaxID=29760 RepID=A0A438HIQ5_VITVI|nr:hypothetical protein CK203_036661 [Vitis vinifera]